MYRSRLPAGGCPRFSLVEARLLQSREPLGRCATVTVGDGHDALMSIHNASHSRYTYGTISFH